MLGLALADDFVHASRGGWADQGHHRLRVLCSFRAGGDIRDPRVQLWAGHVSVGLVSSGGLESSCTCNLRRVGAEVA